MAITKEVNSTQYRDLYDYSLNVTGVPAFTKLRAKTVSASNNEIAETVFQHIKGVEIKDGEKIRAQAILSDGEPLSVLWDPAIYKEEIDQEMYQFRARGISKYGIRSRWLYSPIYKANRELMLGLLINEFADIMQTLYDDEIEITTQHLIDDFIINPMLEKSPPKISTLFPQKESLSYDVDEIEAYLRTQGEKMSLDEQVVIGVLMTLKNQESAITQRIKEDVSLGLEEIFKMGYQLKTEDERVSHIYENNIETMILKSIYDELKLNIDRENISYTLFKEDGYKEHYLETIEELILNGKEKLELGYNITITERSEGLMKTAFSLMVDFIKQDKNVYAMSERLVATYSATLEDIAIIHKNDEIVEQTLYRELYDLLELDIKENPIQYALFDNDGTTIMELAYELLELIKQDNIYINLRKELLDQYVTGAKESYVMTILKLIDDLMNYAAEESVEMSSIIGLIGDSEKKNAFDWLLYEKYIEKYDQPTVIEDVSIKTIEEYACLYKLVSQNIQEDVTIDKESSVSIINIILGTLANEKNRDFSPKENTIIDIQEYVQTHYNFWKELLEDHVISPHDLMNKDNTKKWYKFFEYLVATITEVPHRLIKAIFTESIAYTPQELLTMYFNINLKDYYKEDIIDEATITTDTVTTGFPLGKFIIGTTTLGKENLKK